MIPRTVIPRTQRSDELLLETCEAQGVRLLRSAQFFLSRGKVSFFQGQTTELHVGSEMLPSLLEDLLEGLLGVLWATQHQP